jgi:MFS family permease
MWLDLSPLKKNRDFRYLYVGQFVSFFGTMLTYVALPFQMYHLTQSTLAVGLLGVVELVPLLLTAFIGGALADSWDRKKLLILSEIAMIAGCSLLVLNSLLPHPQVWLLFIIAGLLSGISGLHRPALDAMTPRLVKHHEIQAVSVLTALKGNVGMIGGTAAAGLLIANVGLAWTFAVDCLTFIISLIALSQIKYITPLSKQDPPSFKSVMEALRYAVKRQELLGTYAVDMIAMIFGMPNALFPAVAESFGGAKVVGWLYSAPAIGALVITVFSAWTHKIKRHGAAVAYASIVWGLAITAFGFANTWIWAIVFLALAGAADSVSGIFRTTLWNETIPDRLRGRMASLEMISYMTGPLLGNAEAGLVASLTSTKVSIISGGILCIIGVILCVAFLPIFWGYRAGDSEEA